ncbi:unnamed protein product [Urochloa humidicola]
MASSSSQPRPWRPPRGRIRRRGRGPSEEAQRTGSWWPPPPNRGHGGLLEAGSGGGVEARARRRNERGHGGLLLPAAAMEAASSAAAWWSAEVEEGSPATEQSSRVRSGAKDFRARRAGSQLAVAW